MRTRTFEKIKDDFHESVSSFESHKEAVCDDTAALSAMSAAVTDMEQAFYNLVDLYEELVDAVADLAEKALD